MAKRTNRKMAEEKGLESILSEVNQLGIAERMYSEFDEYLQQVESMEKLEKEQKEATGFTPEMIEAVKNSDKYKQAKDFRANYDDSKNRAIGAVRGGIAALVSGTDKDKLVRAVAVSFEHNSDTHKELAKKFKKYQIYNEYFNPRDEKHGGSQERMEHIARQATSDLTDIIKRKILEEGKITDEKKAQLWANCYRWLVPQNPEKAKKLVEEDYKALKEELGKADIAGYLTEMVKKDDACLNFAGNYYAILNEKKK